MDNMIEIWKEIEGYNGDYQVSDQGKVKSYKCGKEKILEDKIAMIIILYHIVIVIVLTNVLLSNYGIGKKLRSLYQQVALVASLLL